ncbi:thioredoxin domain-containing protein 3 homolog isoform X1 [Lingula anatina]|uniref:Thioredoxin domain-containing protein 3 homolog isoform X1 n=1 Tax=Lingula anatina TaxID=7574 RepID=A0A1S3ISM9_LINAN|nr:thioredoxin domain-containing protein 3 homolog isoform X1 [Lingula anatina]|eukprot:XP_013400539.1 thioredoxin domain-containing protein 3 homolog isoform X1 [Lingula anatina]
MAGKGKKEAAIAVDIGTQEEWEECLAKEGLIVVDVYQEWSGPCKAMVTNLRKLKMELSDDYLHFATAKADTIDALEKYRGKCQPCFLFFAGGCLVAVVRGANAPVIERTLKDQLAQEHKVMEGIAERKEIRDPALGEEEKEKGGLDEEETEKEEAPKKEVTVAIIKPDAVKAGKVEEILEQMKEAGIEVLAQEERQLTDEEAREFYSAQQDQEHFEDLVSFMSSGPSHVLVLTKGSGEGIIQEWRDLLGPTSVEEAKEQAPDSLRAKFGSEKYFNALHGSDSQDTATRELAFFFPNFVMPGSPAAKSAAKPQVQRTLALIRPDALTEHKDAILEKIQEAGFTIAMQKEVQLTKEQAEEFYKEHKDQPYFEELTNRMSCGPLLALSLARDDAVDAWRGMLGPKEVDKAKEEAPESLRAQFAVEGVEINPVHGSDSPTTAQQELEYFFPMQQTLAVVKPDAYKTKDEIMELIKEAGFHIAARKETELTPDIVQQLYKEHEGKEYYGDLVEHMTSGPTLFMVLSKENAVEGWRGIIGPTDPAKAKEEAPDSIRAQFGSDVKANAVHGSSDVEHAKEAITAIFGDLVFEKDGTLKGEEIPLEGEEEATGQEKAAEEGAPAAEEGEAKPAEESGEDEDSPVPPTTEEHLVPAATEESSIGVSQRSEVKSPDKVAENESETEIDHKVGGPATTSENGEQEYDNDFEADENESVKNESEENKTDADTGLKEAENSKDSTGPGKSENEATSDQIESQTNLDNDEPIVKETETGSGKVEVDKTENDNQSEEIESAAEQKEFDKTSGSGENDTTTSLAVKDGHDSEEVTGSEQKESKTVEETAKLKENESETGSVKIESNNEGEGNGSDGYKSETILKRDEVSEEIGKSEVSGSDSTDRGDKASKEADGSGGSEAETTSVQNEKEVSGRVSISEGGESAQKEDKIDNEIEESSGEKENQSKGTPVDSPNPETKDDNKNSGDNTNSNEPGNEGNFPDKRADSQTIVSPSTTQSEHDAELRENVGAEAGTEG